jgi:hypothetical protein
MSELIEPLLRLFTESGYEPAQILAPIVALAVTYVLFYEGFIYKIGSKNNAFFSTLRRVLPFIDKHARDHGFYAAYDVEREELAGTLQLPEDEAIDVFHDNGYIQNSIAAHKSDWEGRREIASLAHYGRDGSAIKSWSKMKRFLMMAFVIQKQTHVTLFRRGPEDIIVTAHHEYSPYCVLRAYKHFRGKGYDVEKGVENVIEDLEDVDEFVVKE